MSFFASSSRIYIQDGATKVFDTDERLFTSATSAPVAGSFTSTAFTVTGYDNITTDTLLASIPTEANTVRGAVKITVSGTTRGVTNKGWYNASGTILVGMRETWPVLSNTDFSTQGVGSLVMFTFFASAGGLYLRQFSRISSPQNLSGVATVTVEAHTLDYYLFPGAFV